MGFIAGNSSRAILVVSRSSVVQVQGRLTFSLFASAVIIRTRRIIPLWLGKTLTTCASGTVHVQWDDLIRGEGPQLQNSSMSLFVYGVSGDNADTVASTFAKKCPHDLGHDGNLLEGSHEWGEPQWG